MLGCPGNQHGIVTRLRSNHWTVRCERELLSYFVDIYWFDDAELCEFEAIAGPEKFAVHRLASRYTETSANDLLFNGSLQTWHHPLYVGNYVGVWDVLGSCSVIQLIIQHSFKPTMLFSTDQRAIIPLSRNL